MEFTRAGNDRDRGSIHKGANRVPKAVLDRNPLPDWVRDLNYVRSQVLQTPSHRDRICALRDNILFLLRRLTHAYGFSAHFQNAHARTMFQKSFAFTKGKISLSRRITIQNALLFAFQKPDLKSWFERALRSQRVNSGFQIRKGSESHSEMAFGTWLIPLWTGPQFQVISYQRRVKGVLKLTPHLASWEFCYWWYFSYLPYL